MEIIKIVNYFYTYLINYLDLKYMHRITYYSKFVDSCKKL